MPLFVIIILVVIAITFVILILIKLLGESKLVKVENLLKQKNYKKANTVLRSLLKSSKDDYMVHWYNARINYNFKNYQQALASLKIVIKNPDAFKELKAGNVHYLLGDVFLQLNKPDMALNEYLLVTQYEPQLASAYAKIGEIYFKQRKNDNALKFLYNAVKYNSKDYNSYYLMGRIYYYMDITDRAVENLKESIKLNKTFLTHYYYLAQLEYKNNNYISAVSYAEKALEDKAGDKLFKLYFLLGNCYQNKNDYKKAVIYYEMVNDEIPTEHPLKKDVYYNLGECYEKQGQIENLMMVWKKLFYMDAGYKDIKEKYLRFSDIQNEKVIKDIIEADNDRLIIVIEEILKKFSLEKRNISFLDNNIVQISANETTLNYSYSVLIYLNRSFDIITIGVLENFLREIRTMSCRKGYYITLADFETNAIAFSEKYPIDLIPRSELIKLLK